MDRFFWVKWKDSKKCEHVVGLLCYLDEKYYFKYNPELKDEINVPAGFNGVPTFGKVVGLDEQQKEKTFSIRSSDELFGFFKGRIVKENETDIWKSEYGFDKYDECEILAKTKGKTPTDSYFVEEMDKEALKDIKGTYVKEEEFCEER